MITAIIRHNTPTTATRTYMSTSGESSSTTKNRREEMSQIFTNFLSRIGLNGHAEILQALASAQSNDNMPSVNSFFLKLINKMYNFLTL